MINANAAGRIVASSTLALPPEYYSRADCLPVQLPGILLMLTSACPSTLVKAAHRRDGLFKLHAVVLTYRGGAPRPSERADA